MTAFMWPAGRGLTPGGYEFLRVIQYREDIAFLIRVHTVEKLLLIFQRAAPDGLAEAICAYYRRVLPGIGADAVRVQLIQDLADLRIDLSDLRLTARVRAYRAEVLANR